MTDRTLYTINVGSMLTENARESFLQAASRWGALYYEHVDCPPGIPPSLLKLDAFTHTDAEHLLIIDADAVISEQCPNPFEALPDDLLSAAAITKRVDPRGAIQQYARDVEWRRFTQHADIAPLPLEDWTYFNAGVLLVHRAVHADVFSHARALARKGPTLAWWEQTPLNYACKHDGILVHVMNERWNYMQPKTLGPNWHDLIQHDIWIMHLAGMPDRGTWLPQLQWRLTPQAMPALERQPRMTKRRVFMGQADKHPYEHEPPEEPMPAHDEPVPDKKEPEPVDEDQDEPTAPKR